MNRDAEGPLTEEEIRAAGAPPIHELLLDLAKVLIRRVAHLPGHQHVMPFPASHRAAIDRCVAGAHDRPSVQGERRAHP